MQRDAPGAIRWRIDGDFYLPRAISPLTAVRQFDF